MRKTVLIFALLVLLFSCTRDKAILPTVTQPPVAATLSLQSIPMTVGSVWTYVQFYNFDSFQDTMVITAVSKVLSPAGDSLYVLQRKTTYATDTEYVCMTVGAITYYADVAMRTMLDKYILPLRVGSVWHDGVYSTDSTFVEAFYPGNSGAYNATYDSFFITIRNAHSSDSICIIHNITSFKAGIGIIDQNSSIYTNYNIGYSLSLFSYHIAP